MTNLKNSPIIAIVFDIGDVLVKWDPYLPFADRMSKNEWQTFNEQADFASLNAMADSGASTEEIVRCAQMKSPQYGELIRLYFERFELSLAGLIPGMTEIVSELKTQGLRLLGLTNWSAQTFHHAPENIPAIREFEAIVVSGYEGISKPDPRIFQCLIDRHNLIPQQTIFIDDKQINVDAARALGFIGIRFTGAAELRRNLREFGVLR